MFNRNSLVAALSAVGMLSLSGAALAQQVVVSGGATLPQPLYQDEINSFPASTFKAYVGKGSGAGKTAFLTNSAVGFDSTGVVHWIGSDSILTQVQINDYLTTGLGKLGTPTGHGPVIQIPSVGTPVTISYKGPTADITLTKAQLCGVLSGKFTKWSDVGVSSGSAPDAFKVIYRSESSGTSELLTRHLQAVCGADSNVAFQGKSTFAQEFPGNTPPAHFVAATGSAGVATAINAEASAITYLSPDPAFTVALKQASLTNKNNSTTYAPSSANVSTALGSTAALPTAAGPVERNPSGTDWLNTNNQANPFNWVRSSVDPASGYPIVGYTNLVISQCYTDPAVATAIKNFLTSHYSAANSVVGGTNPGKIDQHKLVPLTPINRNRVLAAFVTGTAANLNIGNATVCGSYAGRG
ncbi:substrate-binding domain-containing protein [Achromobacter insuavis]|uniref:substrate-binding domain-containing protein n=1 Tax=Achromobacter insuavis TaxID=1287735 RepID=UPI001F12EC6D|nr:substrate-binding domain-containing protein [Achromobacter insuavis]